MIATDLAKLVPVSCTQTPSAQSGTQTTSAADKSIAVLASIVCHHGSQCSQCSRSTPPMRLLRYGTAPQDVKQNQFTLGFSHRSQATTETLHSFGQEKSKPPACAPTLSGSSYGATMGTARFIVTQTVRPKGRNVHVESGVDGSSISIDCTE